MHILAASDLHITNKTPINRKDDYPKSCLNKFKQLLNLTMKTKYKTLLIGGDFFDSHTAPYSVTKQIVNILYSFPEVNIYVVPGQHDQRWHRTGLDNTPLGLLSEYPNVSILKNDKVTKIGKITVIGAGWNEEPKKKADILVTHQMVIKKEKLFPNQKNYSKGISLLTKKYPWAKCIISGDNHAPFKIQYKGRFLVNCGSMMRKSKDQTTHEPRAWLINVNKWTATSHKLKVLSTEDVFDFDKIANEELKEEIREEAEKEIDKFIASLPSSTKNKVSPKITLKHVIKEIKPKKEAIQLINEIMEEAEI